MAHSPVSDAEVEELLRFLGVESLCQWDVLIFLYRHQTSLLGADYLARLLGYAADPILAALDVLESLGLVARSRLSQGARLYQFTAPAEPARGESFRRLLELTGDRAGRLLLSRRLRRGDRTPQEGLEAARRFLEEARQIVRQNRRYLQEVQHRSRQREEGRPTWLRVI